MRDLPGGPVARTQRFHCWGLGLIPGWGTKILEAVRPAKKKKHNEMPFKPPLERLKHLYIHIYIYLIYFWLPWVFLAASSLLVLSVVSVSWGSPFAAVH